MVPRPLPPYSFGHEAQIQPPFRSLAVHSSWNARRSSADMENPGSNQPEGRLDSSQARISMRKSSASRG